MKGRQNPEIASFISSGTDTTRKLLFDKSQSQSTSRIHIEMSDINMDRGEIGLEGEEGEVPQYQFTLQKEKDELKNQTNQHNEVSSKQSSNGSKDRLSFGTSMKTKN